MALRWLEADRFVSSPLNVGSGTVEMAHGPFPVPPPATARLVAGVPVYGAGDGELLTPTGALLLTAFATGYGPLPPMKIEKSGTPWLTKIPYSDISVLATRPTRSA